LFGQKQKNVKYENFWARGYAVSMAGFELKKVKNSIAHREMLEKKQDE